MVRKNKNLIEMWCVKVPLERMVKAATVTWYGSVLRRENNVKRSIEF